MDALPIHEKTNLPFQSKIDGQMHACGHDAHTAILLGTAKALYSMREKIGCRVKLLFQPSEEGIRSGAEEMVNHGVMDDIDVIIGLHVENWLESGKIGVCKGASMASSRNIKLEFFGRTAHATLPQTGHDTLAAAVSTYNGIQAMLTRTINPFSKYVCSVGKLSAGATQNVIADYAEMLITVRTFDMELDQHINTAIQNIAESSAAAFGCTTKINSDLTCFVLYNNPYISELVLASAEKVIGKDNITKMPEKLGSEDFSQYVTKKPGVFIRLGTRNSEKGCITLPHNNDFMIDEDAFVFGSDACVQFVLDNMNGIDIEKAKTSDKRMSK
jgi:amidohydrolase